MNITKIAQKILDFCQGTYPEIKWMITDRTPIFIYIKGLNIYIEIHKIYNNLPKPEIIVRTERANDSFDNKINKIALSIAKFIQDTILPLIRDEQETAQIIRYEQETTQKIFNFCKDRYPEIDWSYSKEYLKKGYLIAFIIGSCFLLKLELKIGKDWLEIEYIQGYLSLQDMNFRGCFLAQLNNDKNSKLEFYESDFDETTKPSNENWNLHKKAKKIMREIFGFIEDEIQQ